MRELSTLRRARESTRREENIATRGFRARARESNTVNTSRRCPIIFLSVTLGGKTEEGGKSKTKEQEGAYKFRPNFQGSRRGL